MPLNPSWRIFLLLAFIISQGSNPLQFPSQRGIRPTESRPSFDVEHSRGVFVGVNRFHNSTERREEFAPIPFAVDDAVDLAYWFSRQARLLEPRNLVLLLEGEPKKADSQKHKRELIEEFGVRVSRPTGKNIVDEFSNAANAVGESGIFITSFATHGYVDDDRQYLLASDSRYSETPAKAVAVRELLQTVRTAKTRRSLLLFDVCRTRLYPLPRRTSEADPESAVTKEFVDLIRETHGEAVLIAAKQGAYALDDPQRRNGVFTAAFLDALARDAPAGESFITLSQLAPIIEKKVCRRTNQLFPSQGESCGITFNTEGAMGDFPLPKVRFDRPPIDVLLLPGAVELEFARIAAGEFFMGEPGNRIDTGPVRTVVIAKPFQLTKYEVTQQQWNALMQHNPSHFRNPLRPVESISWDQVGAFLQRLNRMDPDHAYSLPTEAEWEYVAKTGILPQTEFNALTWHRENSGNATHPVGQKQADAWGLFDLRGNVWEIVADCYSSTFYGMRPSIDRCPVNDCVDGDHVLRGGSYSTPLSFCRPTYRVAWNSQYPKSSSVGFRVLRRPRK